MDKKREKTVGQVVSKSNITMAILSGVSEAAIFRDLLLDGHLDSEAEIPIFAMIEPEAALDDSLGTMAHFGKAEATQYVTFEHGEYDVGRFYTRADEDDIVDDIIDPALWAGKYTDFPKDEDKQKIWYANRINELDWKPCIVVTIKPWCD